MDFFCTSNIDPAIRHKSAEVLAKLCADKLSGPRVKILLSKFLPSIFYEAMSESPQAALNLFDSVTENPEIVWNENAKSNVKSAIGQMKLDLFTAQRSDLSVDWKLPSESFQVDYGVPGELIIGGIYLRLYVTNPSWNLRKPREFLRDLLDYSLSSTTNQSQKKSDDDMNLVGSALGHLLGAQPQLCDALPPMGYMKGILQGMESQRISVKRTASILIRYVATSHTCVEALCHLEAIQPILNGMKTKCETLPLTCEALNHLYAAAQSELVLQGIQTQLVPFLLSLLKNSSDLGPTPSATKAHIIKTLQNMSLDEKYGLEVQAILAKSEVGAQYRDQVCQIKNSCFPVCLLMSTSHVSHHYFHLLSAYSYEYVFGFQKHDLFLSDKPIAGYLTSSTGSVAGYLTQGSLAKSSIPTSPPPLIE